MELNKEMQFQAGGYAGGLSSVSIGVTIIPSCLLPGTGLPDHSMLCNAKFQLSYLNM